MKQSYLLHIRMVSKLFKYVGTICVHWIKYLKDQNLFWRNNVMKFCDFLYQKGNNCNKRSEVYFAI